MAGFVEVGSVCSFAALKILLAEGFVTNLYDAGFVIVSLLYWIMFFTFIIYSEN